MTTILTEKEISSITEFTAFVEEHSENRELVWYRGCGKVSHELKPSLYRHPVISNISDLQKLEKQIMARFKQRSVLYLDRQITYDAQIGDWDWMFFMQHARVPTRLLDWTENPFISLYFALDAAEYQREHGTPKYSESACVWVLDPILWNKAVLQSQKADYNGEILLPGDSLLNGYAANIELTYMNDNPVAIFGTYNSLRIAAQRGVFTIFGKNLNPMENIYIGSNFPQDCLVRLHIPADKIEGLLNSLMAIGFADSVVFPDLGGLAKEIKRTYGFWLENV